MNFPKAAGFDLETAGDKKEYPLQPWRAQRGEAYIKAASISVGEAKAGHLNPDHEIVRKMLLYAISQDMYMVGWNVAFDAAWCIAVGLEQEVFKTKWLDGMLLWRHAKVEPEGDVPSPKRKKFSLEEAMKKYYPDNADFKEFKDFAAEDEESLQKLLHRNKEDAAWTVTLTEKFWHMLDPEQQRAALIEARCIPMMAWCMVNGIYSDAEAAKVLADKLAGEAVDIYKELLASSPEVRGLNLNSTPQLQTLLYDTWGLTAERFSKKTGKPSTDKYALFDLAAIDKRAKLLKKLREAKNNRTKYAIGTLKSLDYNGDGYVRPSPKIFSTYTSRITYGSKDKGEVEVTKTTKKNGTQTYMKNAEMPSGVPLHQWKRGKEYRKLIKPPPGYLLAEFDFAGQEFRWMAVASEDPIMLSLCAPGEDPHSYMGAQVASREYRELVKMAKDGDTQAAVDRKCGKFCNLSYQYRVSAKTATTKARVDFELDVDQQFIQETQNIYRQSYVGVGGPPGWKIGGYWLNQIQKCKQLGYAETFAGRRVQLKGSWAGEMKWPMESTSINYPIQGTGGDQKYLALAVARNHLAEFGGYFYYELHDGLFFIFPEDKALKAAEFFHPLLSNLPYEKAWNIKLPVDFPVDAQVGPSWGELKDLDKY